MVKMDRVQEAMNRLKQAKMVVYDAETSGLDWRKNHCVGHVLTFGPAPQDSYYLPVRHAPGGNIGGEKGPATNIGWNGKLHKIEKDLMKHLDRQNLTIVGHHLNFDAKFLFRLGYKFNPRHEDSMVNAPLLNEHQGRFSLEFCANVEGVQAKKSGAMVAHLCAKFPEAAKDPKKAMGHFWRLPGDDPVAVEYAEGDGTTTLQLRAAQMPKLKKQELMRVWDVECRLIPMLARMSCRGIKINEEKLTNLKKYIKQQIGDDSEAFPGELMKVFGRDFNPRSPTDVKWWMEKHGQTDWPTTPASTRFPHGQPSFTQGWLENSEAGRLIVKVRKLATLRDTFVMPLQTTHLHNGRVHTNYNQLRGDEGFGTGPGRLSSNDPNLQAVPKHDEEIGYIYRELFEPDDGMTWGSPDYNQCEPRLLAFYSRCRVLMQGYLSDPPIDAHTAVSAAANRNWPNMTDKERKEYRNNFGKRINQTIITGGGKKVLVQKYKIPADEVDQVWNDYFRAMPEVHTIQKRMSLRMRQRGYILTLLGRRCRLNDPDKDYVALNRALQGGNADILKLKLVECDEYLCSEGYPIDILNNCHDAVDFQFHPDRRKHYERCLDIMQDFTSDSAVIKLDIPIPVDGGEGPNWAVATYGAKK